MLLHVTHTNWNANFVFSDMRRESTLLNAAVLILNTAERENTKYRRIAKIQIRDDSCSVFICCLTIGAHTPPKLGCQQGSLPTRACVIWWLSPLLSPCSTRHRSRCVERWKDFLEWPFYSSSSSSSSITLSGFWASEALGPSLFLANCTKRGERNLQELWQVHHVALSYKIPSSITSNGVFFLVDKKPATEVHPVYNGYMKDGCGNTWLSSVRLTMSALWWSHQSDGPNTSLCLNPRGHATYYQGAWCVRLWVAYRLPNWRTTQQ